MKIKLNKIIGVMAIIAIFINNSLSFTYAIDSGTSVGTTGSVVTYNSGNPALDKLLGKYEAKIRASNDQTKINQLLSELNNIKTRQVSDSFKDNLIQNTLSSSGADISLTKDVVSKFSITNDQSLALKQLVDSIKRTSKGKYRLFISSSLSNQELTDMFSFFDTVDIKQISTKNDKNVYEINFAFNGRLAKYLGTKLNSGVLPSTLFDNVNTIKPVIVKGDASTGAYLSGEGLANLWGMKSIGATEYQYGLSKNSKVKVAVIDTGIVKTHPDLVHNIGTGDDIGYNFITGTNEPTDDVGHGTHVAGVIGGEVNGKGIFGVNSNATIMPLKVLDAKGNGSSYTIVDAINYAADHGAKIMNMSIGGAGDPTNDTMCDAITNAKNRGVIAIVSAGNNNYNTSNNVPAGCTDAITVGAVDSTYTKASFSNFGAKVDVSAPGVNIYSTYLNGTYANMNGTSMATPFVTGLSAAILSYRSDLGTEDLRAIYKDTNLTEPAKSSVNIGRVINMNKIMASIGAQSDGQLDMPVPSLDVETTETAVNSYKITATASVDGGTIKTYQFYKGTTLVYSGPLSYYQTPVLTQDATYTVKVTDNRGATASKDVALTFTLYLPTLSVTSVENIPNSYKITATASVTGGTIKSYQFYKNSVRVYSGTLNTYQTPVLTQDATYTVKIVDNKGNTATYDVVTAYTLYLPKLNVVAIENIPNSYKITATASVSGGTIVNYNFSKDGVLVYSGKLNYYQTPVLKQDTTYTVRIVDNKGNTLSDDLVLTHKTYIPVIKLTLSEATINNYKINVTASVTGGTIVNYNFSKDGALVYSGKLNYYQAPKIASDTTYTVMVTDNKGTTTSQDITLTYNSYYLPVMTLASSETTPNAYKITTKASTKFSTIVNYNFSKDGVLVYSGKLNYYQAPKIASDTSYNVVARDARGNTVSQDITLVYKLYLPTLTLASTSPSSNVYKITATAAVKGGTIDNYKFYRGDELVYDGKLNYYQERITANTAFTVVATDYKGDTISKTTSTYIYNQPIALDLSFTDYNSTSNKTYISASDSDGKIASVDVYVNGKLYNTYKPLAKNFSVGLISSKSYSYTFRIVAKDNKGLATDQSITVQ